MSNTKNEHNPDDDLCRCRELGDPECPVHGDTGKGFRFITPPMDTTGSGREGETVETDQFAERSIPLKENGQPDYLHALKEWLAHSKRLERRLNAALAQVEALRRDGERLQWILDLIAERGTDGLQSFPWSILDDPANDPDEDDPERLTPILDRAAIDSAQRQEGRK